MFKKAINFQLLKSSDTWHVTLTKSFSRIWETWQDIWQTSYDVYTDRSVPTLDMTRYPVVTVSVVSYTYFYNLIITKPSPPTNQFLSIHESLSLVYYTTVLTWGHGWRSARCFRCSRKMMFSKIPPTIRLDCFVMLWKEDLINSQQDKKIYMLHKVSR